MPAIMAPPTGLTPRPYQQEAVAALHAAAMRGVQRPLLVLPTGTGKTLSLPCWCSSAAAVPSSWRTAMS